MSLERRGKYDITMDFIMSYDFGSENKTAKREQNIKENFQDP